MIYETLIRRQLIDKGWSGDTKYRAEDAEGNPFLLRIAPEARLERRRTAFQRMELAARLDIPMPRPLEFGVCPEGVYTLETWIDGFDGEETVPRFSPEKQYELGIEAGKILKKLHSIPAPEDRPDWESYFNRKIDRKIAMYESCPLKYRDGEALLEYLQSNRHLLKNRPQCYQHGDFHIGNMMVSPEGTLFVIDFDKDDNGDPWEEFNRIVWSAQATPAFAAGTVDGYFDGNVPMDFWHLMALYICSNSLGSLPWAIPFGEQEVRTMEAQAADILRWYDNMNRVIPTWYTRP